MTKYRLIRHENQLRIIFLFAHFNCCSGMINSRRRDTTTYLSVYSFSSHFVSVLITKRIDLDCTDMSQLQRSNRSLNSFFLSLSFVHLPVTRNKNWLSVSNLLSFFLSNTILHRDLYLSLRNRTNTDVCSSMYGARKKNY